jgi:hypothetical protein
MRRRFIVLVALGNSFGQSAWADPIEIPNVFTSGTTARAADVNENFAVAEAAINDHDARIEVNANDIAAITTEVQQLRQPVAVFGGNGNEIGLLIGDGTFSGHVVILSEQGYDFTLSRTTGIIREGVFPTYYATTNCSGPSYVVDPPGAVFRSINDPALYYVDRESAPISIANGSYWYSSGVCANLVVLDAAWPSLPNDPAITGVSNQPYPLPIKLARP